MEGQEYQVEVVYRQRVVYRVLAADREAAEQAASELWQAGHPGELAGLDWSEVESIEADESTGSVRRAEDAELVLRFLRERERLIVRLGGSVFGPGGNDALSAVQVASDLGWVRRRRDGRVVPDTTRATGALEWLCRGRRLISFSRPRVRAGERGEIRLYCTPEYLEALSSEAGIPERQAV